MKIKRVIYIFLLLVSSACYAGEEVDYEALPIPCRYDVREFYTHMQNLINTESLEEDEKNAVKSLQKDMIFPLNREKRDNQFPSLDFLKPKLEPIKNNVCVIFINERFFGTPQVFDFSFRILDIARNSLLPSAVRFVKAAPGSRCMEDNEFHQLTEERDLEKYLTLSGKVRNKHNPSLIKILKFEGKYDYYEKMYQAIYTPLLTGFQSYRMYGYNKRLSAIVSGIIYDCGVASTFYLASSLVFNTHKSTQSRHELSRTKTIPYNSGEESDEISSISASSNMGSWLGVISLIGRQLSTIQAIRGYSSFVPTLFKKEKEKEEEFEKEVRALALVVSCKIVALEKKNRMIFSESSRRKISAKILSAVRMDVARSFSAGTVIEALRRLIPGHRDGWASWTYHGMAEAYASQPADLIQNENLMKKVFGSDFVDHLWDKEQEDSDVTH